MAITSCFRVRDALDAYLARIGFEGEALPNLATLRELHRLHVEAVTFENIDVQLGTPVSRNPRAAFRKIVVQGRGGWCFESNGLFAFMLEAIGFRVQRLAAGVMREKMGAAAVGNHLALAVKLDRTYLCDVSVGVGLVEPAPLVEGPLRQGFKRLALERVGGGWWRLHNHPGAVPASFDFSLEVTDEALLDEKSRWLEKDPASPFVCNAIAQRHFPDRLESLVGRTHSVLTAEGERVEEVESAEEYARLLRDVFQLQIRDVAPLWARVSRASGADFLASLDLAA
ncbi:MAG TPA: arylamine N-acetyltransferase [Allosphingosinicella sp.]|jgi:N-hydroxyarylamine O-acetyltransferase